MGQHAILSASASKRWMNCTPSALLEKWERMDTYGPKLVENIVQGTSRDILAEAMMRLNKAGFSIVFHVHDEAVLEVPEGKSSVEEVCRIMAEPPSWVHGLPLRADGYECQFYKKD